MSFRRPRHAALPTAACAMALLLGLAILPTAATSAADLTLHEAGSTLLYPLFQRWVPDYVAAHAGTAITTDASGSGDGIAKAIARSVQIGASDAYMSDEQMEQNPGIMNIPLAISAQTVNYNVPGLSNTGLKLDGPTLAGIYAGTIRMWDAPEIAAMNPGVKLPHQAIIPVRRADPSGDTFLFTQFLDFSTQHWEDAIGYGTTVSWPAVDGERTATGNEGMVQALAGTPYTIGYVGISFHGAIAKAGLGTAMVKNQAGKFLLPTADTVSAAASELDPRTPADERLSLAFAPGDNSYPLINYEYAVVAAQQPDPGTAATIRHFLLWAVSIEGGNAPKYLDAVQFIPLPDFIRALSENQINRVH
ncbi:MAG TPA: phosphate ABC transporter substrate-binding protein PstS [Acetobacteraceae bacterium]|jgi:phosphate transport system substrate-binding protein|nr:phosphate ABC transporter substrate-binding protein PstS [Acetobacteraceae bacterium]